MGCPNGDPTQCILNWHIPWRFKSTHPGGVTFACVDGSVHFIRQEIDHQTDQYLGCHHDGQAMNRQGSVSSLCNFRDDRHDLEETLSRSVSSSARPVPSLIQ
jgi:hypothetical protein